MMAIRNFSMFFKLIIICFHASVSNSKNLTCNPDDLRALRDFQNGLNSGTDSRGAFFPGIDWWNTSDCCSWVGVACNSSSKRVVGLELGSRNLRGRLSESLAGLEELKSLNISHNILSGALPMKLFQMQNLEVLDLRDNEFSGFIPGQTDLPSILFLDISQNYLSGSLATNLCSNSTKIKVLDLSTNNFSGNFPAGFGKCPSLEHLILNSNKLLGSLPEDLFWLQKLCQLHLQDNVLYGPLSGAVNLSSLVELDISLNRFSGTLPDVFMSLERLERFTAHSNNFTGRLPFSLLNSQSIQFLDVRNNSLGGPIDLNCTAMVQLRFISLASNEFHGPIPDSLSFCRNLTYLDLARNQLGGQVPKSFKHLQSLSVLSLGSTGLHNISGALEVLQNCKNLRILVLTRTFIGEELPAYPSPQFRSLEALIIPNCDLTGLVPQWLSSCTKLQLLDLSWNRLGGMIPDLFSVLRFLFYVDLSNNYLSGKIPKSLTQMESLIDFPEKLIPFETTSLDMPLFKRTGPGARVLRYNQIWRFPPTLNLSYNRLSGPIWMEFGNLRELCVLDLQQNHLSGPIPGELSSMKSLETLDLSHNDLSGTIPPSLSTLIFLSKFSIAYNHLHGVIPSGGQFSTFLCSSFEENNGLIILFCNSPPSGTLKEFPAASPTLRSEPKKHTIGIIDLPFGIGASTGFLLAVIICFKTGLLLPKKKKKFRRARYRN